MISAPERVCPSRVTCTVSPDGGAGALPPDARAAVAPPVVMVPSADAHCDAADGGIFIAGAAVALAESVVSCAYCWGVRRMRDPFGPINEICCVKK